MHRTVEHDAVTHALFVSWVDRRGRSEGLARALGVADWTDSGGTGPLPLRYLRLWRRTWAALDAARPTAVLVMQPPVVLLLLVRLWGGRHLRVVGDLHTGAFLTPKWRWSWPLTMRLLGPDGLAIVTNDETARRVTRAGVPVLVLHDLIEAREAGGAAADLPAGCVLAPLSYASDEPLAEILEAARRSERPWVLTGRAPDALRAAAPPNVRFTGFLTDEDYPRVLESAAVVVALTTLEETMQRAGYEALCAGRALVTSDRAVLRAFFEDAAVLVAPDAAAIAAGVEQAFAHRIELEARMLALRARRAAEQRAALDLLSAWLRPASVDA